MRPTLYVLAGVNGSGKSSVGGAVFTSRGVAYYNPDTVAGELRARNPSLTPADANSRAWTLGKGLLEQAIARKMTYAFETTLGGNTMTRLLIQAARNGIPVKVWYVGLATVDQNIARVQARAARGGHDIPEAAIRRRWNASRRNLIQLLPYIESLRLYDNSIEADPQQGHRPRPELLLHVEAGAIAAITPSEAPDWAKPIIAGAINTFGEP